MTLTGYQDFAQAIARTNALPLDLAERFAALIGDTPELDEAGRAVVTDHDGRELARIELPAED